MKHPSRIADRLRLELTPRERPGRIAFHAARWGLLVALALLTYLLYPVTRGFDVVALGEVAPAEVIAPFEVLVLKSTEEINRDGDALASAVRPIYEYREAAIDTALAHTDAIFATIDSMPDPAALSANAEQIELRQLTLEEAQYLKEPGRAQQYENAVRAMVRRHLRRGVPRAGFLESERSPEILRRQGVTEALESRDSVFTFERFLQSRVAVHPDPNSQVGDGVFTDLLLAVFRPTLVPLTAETDSLRAARRRGVNPVRDTVRANERIVDANEVVTADVRDRLLSLRGEMIRRGRTEQNLRATLGQILANGMLLALFWVLLMLFLPETYASLRRMLVISLLFALAVSGAAAAVQFLPGEHAELIPIPFAAMLVSILFGGRLAMVSAVVMAMLIGSQAVYGGPNALFVAFVGGVTAALSVRTIRRRNQLLVAVLPVAGAFLLAALTIGLRLDLPFSEIGPMAALGAVNALGSAALVTITLPLFESMAGVTTELTLLELSDPNRPLLRRLASEAPGTYAHSIALANLCEAACNAVGANGLLARVGCYYHDVGKLKKPQFFVENQAPGLNPHDKLKPDVSASIIKNHVKEGIALANEHRLPDAIKAFIAEHHGTMEITYFLERARSRNGETEINVDDYRYPGPKPQLIETAVAMLGDGVEAALRVIEDPTPQKIGDAIDHLIRQRMAAAQLDQAPLTFAQLQRIRDVFVKVEKGIHHNRIDYPTASGGLSAEWKAAATSET